MASRIAPMRPVYQRGQFEAQGSPKNVRQRRPRKRDRDHLAAIAKLPCVIPDCGNSPVHVAHIRFACAAEGADIVGKASKPDDWRTLPLCARHHLEGPDSQHAMNEEMFWYSHGINPYALARALYNLSGQSKKMHFLILHARALFPSRA